jgi:histone H3/H4
MGRTQQTDGNKPSAAKKSKVLVPDEETRKTVNKDGSLRKKPKFHPGTVDRREGKKLMRSVHVQLRKKPFERLVRDVVAKIQEDVDPDADPVRIKRLVFPALQEATERHMVVLYKQSVNATAHGKRKKLMGKDVRLVCGIRNGGNNPFEPTLAATTGGRGQSDSSSD